MRVENPEIAIQWFTNGIEFVDQLRGEDFRITAFLTRIPKFWPGLRMLRRMEPEMLKKVLQESRTRALAGKARHGARVGRGTWVHFFLGTAASFILVILLTPWLGESGFSVAFPLFELVVIVTIPVGVELDPGECVTTLRYLREFAAKYNIGLQTVELRLRHNDYPGLEYTPHPEGGYTARIKQ